MPATTALAVFEVVIQMPGFDLRELVVEPKRHQLSCFVTSHGHFASLTLCDDIEGRWLADFVD